MTLKSLYTFFKAYFNYVTSGNRAYARAISEAMAVIRETLTKKTLNPIQIYLHKQFSFKLAKDMLQKAVSLAMSQYQDPFNEIQYFKITVTIDKSFITTNHKGINIPIEGGWDNKNNKLIIITFSQPSNMVDEVRVIKGLIKEFTIVGTLPANIKTVAYWDLSKGKITEIDYQVLQPVDKQSLINAANRI
ncbi:hypothetical protein [Clostridium beijerinckii]|uniref:Uncharacterized protein n=3 Tax=Clostridium beijerinckii TaxID=1520 RepID=A0A9Q5GK24_CLOBE|nr:hypothetical protein [Clostridium beijerinckii]AQS05899.1 hypothetical protein CLBIJ_33420 [Clostridium beijerinckii]MBA2887875.1 hypothetical protein [Clostridium beijerinckii]MBA2902609.1 hypothetical protein [Clostridium beijerinckii]MBA2912415.1 hypothetical protein [Clostridium beijerinckii]MBA9014503.1 hypothetical protein [Clostridium beijerinckii]